MNPANHAVFELMMHMLEKHADLAAPCATRRLA
jgi:hypothetical protein